MSKELNITVNSTLKTEPKWYSVYTTNTEGEERVDFWYDDGLPFIGGITQEGQIEK